MPGFTITSLFSRAKVHVTFTRTSTGGGGVEETNSFWLGWCFTLQRCPNALKHICYSCSPIAKSQQCLTVLVTTNKIRFLPPSSPRKSAMSRASSILAEWFGTQVPLCTCFGCFGTGKIPPDYRKSLKTMSRVSYWRPQVLLPRQTYRVVLKRSFQDYSQSLCDEVQLCSHCTTELMTHSS